MKKKGSNAVLRGKILGLSSLYCERYHATKAFKPGDRISYASRVFDSAEIRNLIDSALDFWLTAGRYTEEFEKRFAEFMGVRYCGFVNSGSSANLLAFMALTSPLLKDRAIKRGDEVITAAAGFPTTVAPIIQYGAVPVFIDVTLPQYNVDVKQLKKALSKKTKAVMLAHTLGNPFDVDSVTAFCRNNGLWLIEDNCDSLGSLHKGKLTGTFGDIGTSSFYPPHHMTTGEGGAVYTDNPLLYRILVSMRDWGRDCLCKSGRDNACGHRFDGQYGELPRGYDHKYVYSHFGYNLKATDMQAAIGVAQLEKLPGFIKARRANFAKLKKLLSGLEDKIILPESCPKSEPSWFGFLITLREEGRRDSLVKFLEARNIQTRMLFAGNIIKHPCFDTMRKNRFGFRVAGGLVNTDRIMRDTFWVGVYPGMTDGMIKYMAKSIREGLR